MRQTNGTLEDICADIGFTATMRLVALLAGEQVYVPTKATSGHAIEKMIGERPFVRMVENYGGEVIRIPAMAEFDNLRLLPGLARRIAAGESTRDISRTVGLTEQHIRRLRAQAEELGLLPFVIYRRNEDAAT